MTACNHQMVSSPLLVLLPNSSELDLYTDIDAVNPEEDLSGSTKPADLADANMFEVLTEYNVHPGPAVPNHCAIDSDTMAKPSNAATKQVVPFDLPDVERLQTVVINHFLLGNAGTPIPGMACESNEDTATQSIWVLFVSQCDWEVAHWGKICGLTLSALTDLLAIGEVHILFNLIWFAHH